MSNLLKIQDHLAVIHTATDNTMHGRMPLENLEEVFQVQAEYIQSIIDSEKHNQKKEKVAK
jgi:hypothetical protein